MDISPYAHYTQQQKLAKMEEQRQKRSRSAKFFQSVQWEPPKKMLEQGKQPPNKN